ncbi:hypothetical protein ACRARG_10670 [Pseudooceanicola sp. C21-150M6]|uniref:hypothetical protein n=1 Tax=Pseudooceanicola sp. C21-150M6 TaxID=3434355 RepID=UPI003D7F79A6
MSILRKAILTSVVLGAVAGAAQAENKIKYQKKVSLKVGQAMVVHGMRGECGAMPTKAQIKKMEQRYGKLGVGRIVAGKPGTRNSKSCGGKTPAIEAIFVAETPGQVMVDIFGDPIAITVK